MAKKINIIANLIDKQLRKQLRDIENGKYKINVEVDNDNISKTSKHINQVGNAAASANTTFGKLKSTISDTFSTGGITITMFLAVLNEIRKAGKNAKQTIEEIDEAITNLSISTNMTREATAGLVKDYNNYAKELKSTTTQVTSAADDYLRAGKSMSEAKDLIKDSIMLSKLGQIDSATATEDLLATMNGYEMSIEEVGRALDAMVAIDMEAATSSGDIATALKYCASSADVAGVSFNKLAGMIGAVQDKTQQSAETVGTFMNTLLSRYRDVKIGNYISDDGEDLSDYESVLKSVGISLRDSENEFRNYEDVLQDMASKWNTLSSVQQATLGKTASGVRQQNRFYALMEGYNKVLELTEVAANSAGTAVEKFNNSYTNSLEAKRNTLKAAFESMVINSDFDEVYSGIIEATTALVDFMNQTNALKGIMAGLTVSTGIKFFLAVKSGANEAYISLNKFANALKIAKQTNISTADFDKLLVLSKGLSASQMKLIVSTNALSVSQKKELLVASGLSEEEAILQLQTWKMTTAQTGLTAATTSLGNAFKGLFATLMANPIILIVMAISGAVMAFQSYNQKVEEMRQRVKESANEAKTLSSEISELTNKYIELSEAVKTDASAKEDLMSTQTELLKKLGLEGEGIDALIEKYGSLSEAIKQASIDSLQNARIDLLAGVNAAKEEVLDIGKDGFWGGNNIINATGDDAVKAFKELEKAGIVDSGSFGTGGGSLVLIGDDTTTEGILENYERLEKGLAALRDSNAFTAEELSDNSLYQAMYARYSEMTEAVNNYKGAIGDLNENVAQETMLTALQGKEIPKTEEDFETFRQELIDTAVASKQFIGNEKEITDAINNYLSTVPQFEGFYSIPLENELDKVDELLGQETSSKIFTLSEDQTKSIEEFESKVKSLGDTLSKLSSGEITDEDLTNLFKDFPELANEGDNLSNAIQELIYDSLENLYKILGENLPQNFRDSLQGIANKAALNIKTISDSISDLQSIYDLMQTAKDEMANGGISASTLQNIASKYPDLEDAVNAYCAGLITEQELYAELEKQYDADYEAFQAANQAKIYENELFFEKSYEKNGELINALADKYKLDLKNFKTVEEAKLKGEAKLLGKLAGLWGEYYDIVIGKDGLYHIQELNSGYDVENDPNYIALEESRLKMQEFIDDLNESFDLGNLGLNFDTGNLDKTSSSAKSTAETFDWLKVKITRATEALEKFTEARENAFDSYGNRNSALSDEISKTKELLILQEQAAEAYRNHAETIALSEDYKEKVRNGQIKIEPGIDEDLKSKIDEYQTWYNKSVECRQEVDKLKMSLSELAQTKFEMITSQFENVISVFEKRTDSINNAISLTEAKGYAVSTKYYEALINDEMENIKLLEMEREELTSSLNEAVDTGKIKENSEAWYDMYSSILDVNSAIEDSNVSLVEFQNTIRELKWDSFDRLQDSISQIVDESDFIKDLFSNEEMFDDNGYMYGAGIATAGQHSVNYNVLMRQADEYGNEYKSVMAELANDPNNQTLIDRTRELVQAQRDAIKSAQDEKQALIDLAREGIQKEIDAMQKLVDVKKKMLQTDTSLYEYEQNIAEQADNIASIEKQIVARQGDNSEENKKVLQQLNKELSDAEKKLQETEYDRWKSDQQDMLDNMMSEYEETQNERMKQTDMLFNNMIGVINSNSSLINDVINDATAEVGYQITSEMESIWSGNGVYQDTVSNYVNGADNRVNAVIDSIRTQQEENQRVLDRNAENTVNSIQTIGNKVDDLKNALLSAINGIKASNTNVPTNTPTNNGSTSGSSNSASTSDSASGSGKSKPSVGDQVYASGRWYTSSTGNETGIDVAELIGKVDFFKVQMVREGAAHPYFIQAYKNGVAQGGNGWVNLDQLAGYKNGTRKVTKDQLAWINEDGAEGVYRASDGAFLYPAGTNDMVFTNEQMQRLWEFTKTGVVPNVRNGMPKLDIPTVANNNTTIGNVKQEVNINLPNVPDPASFREAIKSDKALRSQIQSLVLDPLTGRNSFGYKRY